MEITEKNNFIREFSRYLHKDQRQDNFYSSRTWSCKVLIPDLQIIQIILASSKIGRVFVPKFYHGKRARNVLKHLECVGEYGPDNVQCEYPEIGRNITSIDLMIQQQKYFK